MSRNALLSLNFIKTVYVLALWMIAGWSFIATAQAAQVTLAWTASSSANVGGYHLVYGEASRSYTQEIDVGKQTLYTVTNLEQGRTYYFAVHAYDTTRTLESANSNEVSLDTTLVADFTANPTSGIAPLQTTFTDNSSGAVNQWSWDFGDGSTSTEQNPPAHTYPNAGTYQVRLTVNNSLGSTHSKTISITAQAPASAPLPSPWQSQDVGAVGLPGSADYVSGVFTLTGAGADIGGARDAFHFAHQSWTGDGVFVGRVTALANTDPQAKVGLMIRDSSLDPSAPYAMVLAIPTYQISFQSRTTFGGTTFSKTGKGGSGPWLKLVRAGSTITAYQSTNGRTWKQVGSVNLNLGATVRVGLAVTSRNSGVLATATLDNVSITN